MTYNQAIKYAMDVKLNKEFAKEGSPKEVSVLDVQELVACVKIKAWWGIDYLLLTKNEGSWKINQVLWQGPLSITR